MTPPQPGAALADTRHLVMTPADAEDVKAAVLAAYRDQNRWMVEGRTDRLAELLADNYTVIHISGYQQAKDEWLDQIDSGRMTYDAVREVSAAVEIKGRLPSLPPRRW